MLNVTELAYNLVLSGLLTLDTDFDSSLPVYQLLPLKCSLRIKVESCVGLKLKRS